MSSCFQWKYIYFKMHLRIFFRSRGSQLFKCVALLLCFSRDYHIILVNVFTDHRRKEMCNSLIILRLSWQVISELWDGLKGEREDVLTCQDLS